MSLPNNINGLPSGLTLTTFDKKDTEGRKIILNQTYTLSNGLIHEAINYIKSVHGEDINILPMSAISAGGNVFNTQKYASPNKKIGLIISPPQAISHTQSIPFTQSDAPPTKVLKTHELHIDMQSKMVYAGAGVVLDQLKATVQEALGPQYNVLGTDLTSSGYASVGATFMTGGMGPSRNNFALGIKEILFFNGSSLQKISNKEMLCRLAETYGYNGMVQSIALPIYKMPRYEFDFALPINATPDELGQLIHYFYDKTLPIKRNFEIINDVLITGIELITAQSLELLYKHTPNMNSLQALLNNQQVANKTDVVFISGYAQQNIYENPNDPLGIFATKLLSGLALEQALPFQNQQDVKVIREAAPDLARGQYAQAPYFFKDHTDINIRIKPYNNRKCMIEIMQDYQSYKNTIDNYIKNTQGLDGNIQIYGHLNPQGVDPHYRITLIAYNAQVLEQAILFYHKTYDTLVQRLSATCQRYKAELLGGEKGLITNAKIINSLKKGLDTIPEKLAHKFAQQTNTIKKADALFSWRSII